MENILSSILDLKTVSSVMDELAPDGSEIRLLHRVTGASFCQCTLPKGKTSLATSHKTIDEIWYFTAGTGEVWREDQGVTRVDTVEAGICLTIPREVKFQFKNTSDTSLEFFIVTSPPWPGPTEAKSEINYWDI
jgi:mannose-6-phosphate isomerase-like protein (cupin superfamily)